MELPRLGAVLTIVLLAIFLNFSIAEASGKFATAKGSRGEILTASNATLSRAGAVKIIGAHFDETVGIYLAYCVLPSKGKLPTPCGGGVNKSGIAAISFWISSNPPPYGIGLAEEYLPGGRFTQSVQVTPMIGKFDCRKITCAITVRADHTREGDRSYDLFIPITFKK